jgi:ferritin-like protein
MTDWLSGDVAQRVDNILGRVDFFKPVTTRRKFMSRLLAAGGGAAIGGAFVGRIQSVFASTDTDVVDFGNAAVGAERIGIAFYANALGTPTAFGVTSDQAKGTLLNSAHRVYFNAARNQETSHLGTLQSLQFGLKFPFSVFSFPAGTFDSASNMLAFGEKLEDVFIGAYLGAIKVAAADFDSTGTFVAEAAAQIMGIECEHRVLIRDIAGLNPPNDRFYEGDVGSPSGVLGNTGTPSTVYGSGGDAVKALLKLGVIPVS